MGLVIVPDCDDGIRISDESATFSDHSITRNCSSVTRLTDTSFHMSSTCGSDHYQRPSCG